jgi:hypothetical protein
MLLVRRLSTLWGSDDRLSRALVLWCPQEEDCGHSVMVT